MYLDGIDSGDHQKLSHVSQHSYGKIKRMFWKICHGTPQSSLVFTNKDWDTARGLLDGPLNRPNPPNFSVPKVSPLILARQDPLPYMSTKLASADVLLVVGEGVFEQIDDLCSAAVFNFTTDRNGYRLYNNNIIILVCVCLAVSFVLSVQLL